MVTDPFDVLGLEARFDIDAAALQRAYLKRSAELHPDHDVAGGAGGGPEGGEGGEAAGLNQAKRVLEDPEQRAEALLRRLGGPTREADRSLPPEFLAEIMEIRERIEADLTGEGSGGAEKRAEWEDWAEERRAGHIRRVRELFKAHAEGAGGEPTLREIRRELNVWRYTERLLEQLDAGAGQVG